MEKNQDQPETKVSKVVHYLADHIRHAPDRQSNHYRPSAQRDVGRSALEARRVQIVIEGLQHAESAVNDSQGVLFYLQPDTGVGYTDYPDDAA
jgi:hypothetical protein